MSLIPLKAKAALTIDYGTADVYVEDNTGTSGYRGVIVPDFGTVSNDSLLRVNGVIKPVVWCISDSGAAEAYIEFDFSDNALATAVMDRILGDWSSIEDTSQTHWGAAISPAYLTVDGTSNNLIIYHSGTALNAWDGANDNTTYTIGWF